MSDLRDLGEDAIIDLFNTGSCLRPVHTGIGDDCAIIDIGGNELLLWTIDLLAEGIHFEVGLGSPFQIGGKALAVNLSDIAAMGGRPEACLLSLSMPAGTKRTWIYGFRDGFLRAAARSRCQIIGGDTCAGAGSITINVSVLGRVRKSDVLLRAGAKDGDDIWLSGTPGLSALGLEILKNKRTQDNLTPEESEAVTRHLEPEPELELGMALAAGRLATSCIDTSDGLSIDLTRICAINRLGAAIEESALSLGLLSAVVTRTRALELALHGGEDYGLLFTARPFKRREIASSSNVVRIGRMSAAESGIILERENGLRETVRAAGFRHF